MESVTLKEYSKYFFILTFIFVIIISFFMIKPFISVILGAIIISYIFNPIKKYLLKFLKNKNLCAVLTIILVFLIIIIPMFFAIKIISKEVLYVYTYVVTHDITEFIPKSIVESGTLASLENNIDKVVERLSIDFVNKIIPNFLLGLPKLILSLFIMIFIMFYLFRDGEEIIEKVREWLPIAKKEKDKLFDRISKVSHAVIYGHILTAIIQGVLGIIGFFFLGVPSPILWGFMVMIFGLIPFIGTPIVWVPIGLIQVASGNVIGGILILVYGGLIISSVDNVIKPRIISKKAKVHPVLILLGIVGGIKLFGVVGFIVGPLVLAIFMVFLDFYMEGS